MEQPDSLRKIFKNAVIICAAIMATLPIYILVVEIIRASQKPFHGLVELPNIGTIRYLFYALAVIQVIVIRILRGFLLKKQPSADASALMSRLYAASVFPFALCEVPVIFGLILFLLGGLYLDFYMLLFVSFILMFMYFPRYNNWADWLKGNNPSNCSPPCF